MKGGVSDGGNFCLLWLMILKSVCYNFSFDTVGLELWLAILSSLLFPVTDWNICIGNQ